MKRRLKKLCIVPLDYPKWWSLLRSFVTTTPALLLAYLKFQFSQPPTFCKSVVEYFAVSPWAVVFLLGATFPISMGFDLVEWWAKYMKGRENDSTPDILLPRTLAALNHIVGLKSQRLAPIASACAKGLGGIEDALKKATEPDLQVSEIVRQIWILLAAFFETERLKVVLTGTYPNSRYYHSAFCPNTEQPPNELLSSKETFIEYLVQSRTFQCIPDVAKHLAKVEGMSNTARKKVKTARFLRIDGAENSGSICGFVLIDQELSAVVYVLTIMHPEPHFLTNKIQKRCANILSHFISRLLLEHRVKIIRDHGNTRPD